MNKRLVSVGGALILSSLQAFGDSVAEQNITTFSANTPAVASEVNANFQALIAAINDNASRIEDLELDANDNFVGGRTYRIFSINAEVAGGDGNADQQNDFANISTGALEGVLVFDEINMTGTLTVTQDEFYEVNIPGYAVNDFSDSPSDLGAAEPFTFEQTGNSVTVTIPEDGGSFEIIFTVAGDGNVIVGSSTEKPSATTFGDGSPGVSAFNELIIGVRTPSGP